MPNPNGRHGRIRVQPQGKRMKNSAKFSLTIAFLSLASCGGQIEDAETSPTSSPENRDGLDSSEDALLGFLPGFDTTVASCRVSVPGTVFGATCTQASLTCQLVNSIPNYCQTLFFQCCPGGDILSLSSSSATTVYVRWYPRTTINATGYRIYRNGYLIRTVGSTITAISDTGRTASTTYRYQIQVRKSDGTYSALSAPLSITTPPR